MGTRFRSTFDQAAVGIVHTTTDGKILEVNPSLCEMLGYSANELLAMTTRDLTHADDRDQQDKLRRELVNGKRGQFSGDKRYVRKDGSVVWVNRTVALARETQNGEPYLIQTIYEIDARIVAESELKSSLSLLQATLDSTTDGILVVDGGGRVMSYNQRFLELWRIPAAIAKAQDDQRLLDYVLAQLAEPERFVARVLELYAVPERSGDDVLMFKDGRVYERYSRPQYLDGKIVGRVWSFRDVTANKRAEASLQRLSRARRVMTECTRILVHATNETEMLTRMCRVVVESGGYKQAWIGVPTGDEKNPVNAVAHAGYVNDGPMNAAVTRSNDGRYQGAAAIAFANGKTHIVRDIPNDPQHERLRARAMELGYTSSIALPVIGDTQPMGVLVVHADDRDAFDKEEIRLLNELAGDIGFGIVSLRARAAREQAEEHSQENERRYREVFEQAAVGLTRVDLNGVLVDCNQKFCELLGYTREELLGKTIKEITHPDDYGKGLQYRAELMDGQQFVNNVAASRAGEKRFMRKDGNPLWARRTMSTACDAAGRPQFVISVVEDITERKNLEQRNQETFEQAAVGIVHTSIDGRYLRVNRKFCEMLGYDASKIVGHTAAEFTHPDDPNKGQDQRQILWEGKIDNLSEEKRYVRKDGRVLWTNRTVSLARDGSGNPMYFIRVIEDITERKAAEERYRATFDNAPVGIMHTSIEGYRILRANRKLCEMLGYTQDELLRMTITDVVHPDYRFTDARHYQDQILSDRLQTFASERVFVRKDGSTIWVNRTVSLVKDAAGKPDYYIRVVEDITKRKQAEAAIAHERTLLETIINTVPEYIHVKDTQGRFLLANRAWINARGLSNNDEIKGKTVFDFFARDVAEIMTTQDGDVIKHGIKTPERETKIVLNTPDGERDERWAATSKVPMRDSSGNIIGTVGVSRDITEHKRGEEALRASEARFRATFNSAPVGIVHTSVTDNRILEANPKVSEMLGYSHDELLGMEMPQIVHQDQPYDSDRLKYREQMLSGKLESYASERKFLRKDGSVLWVNRIVSLARDAAGQPLYFIRIIEDINERVLFTQRIAMEHAVTQTLAESATLEEAMQHVVRTICQALEWTCGAHWIWNETDQMLRCAETWHDGSKHVADFIAASRENPNEAPAWRGAASGAPTGGVVRRVWMSGAPAWFPDVMQQPDFRRGPAAAAAGLHSAFGFPILSGTQPLGVMEFYGSEIKQPDDAMLKMLQAIGSQIGQFIQRKEAEDKVAYLAQFDTVTGLPNRFLFIDRLDQMLAQSQRNKWSVGILFVDLDRFKVVNDTYGHATGDQLLRQVAARMKDCVRSGDTVGRLSGDEYAVMLSNLARADDAGMVANKIVEALAVPFDLDGHQTHISASIGIALYPGDGSEPDTLLKNADTAMYRAKEQGRNGYQFYLPQMNELLVQRQRLDEKLRGALDRKEFVLHYQPKVSLATGAINGFEALLRWQRGEVLVPPIEFISILEDTGLIVPVGAWVLRSVCAQLKQWEHEGIAPRPIAVNVSARQFQGKNLVDVVEQALRESAINPALLKLELTESLLMSDAKEAVETLYQLKHLGVQLSVDDFGTGYSSLAYLKRFPLDELKIDRAFIRDAVSDPDDAAIALTIINLAHSLNLTVVAEGVETEGQLNFLRLHGCDELQGYFFSRPVPVADCTRMLVEDKRLHQTERTTTKDAVTLLLVGENEDELRRIAQTLAPEGFSVLTATSASDGFEILARQGADIVISDNELSGMSGVEFLTRVRKLYPNTVRVLASSGGDAPTLTRAINRAGIHWFLPRDWTPERLCSGVREAVRQRTDAVASGPNSVPQKQKE